MTYEEQIKIKLALNEKISNVILIFLLLVRFLDQDLAVWIFGVSAPNWFLNWYSGIPYILTATIIWLNRHRLAALNIDRPFIIAVMLGGILYAFYLTPVIGIFVGMTAGFMYVAYQYNLFVFKNPAPYPKGTGLLIFLSTLLALAPVLLFRLTVKTSLNFQAFISAFFGILIAQLAGIVFEEVIFRGALWASLQDFGLSERAAFFIQAILFWVAHHKYLSLNDPYFFLIALPIITILLGLLAWRSKSLTPSLIGHFLFNFITKILITLS
jgi:membrane protease YdiL (CAAX protease family)